MLIKFLACITLAIIAYQDFRYRAIHWLLFLFVSVLFIIDGLLTVQLIQYVFNIIFNILLIMIQFLMLYLFYIYRGRNLKTIVSSFIGVGDIIFILILSLAFSWQNFLFYYIGSLIFSIIIWFVLKQFSMVKGELVPFAGLMAIFFILVLIIELIIPVYGRFNDHIYKVVLNG
jgi:hypothetical protein